MQKLASRLAGNLKVEGEQGFCVALGVLHCRMGEASGSTSHSRQDPSLLGYGFHGAIANSTPPANFL
jgi:hypothetical protein